MRIDLHETPRKYTVNTVTIADQGKILLAPDEQLTFVTESGKEHDFARKSWGFYATPSMNGRLRSQGFKTALVVNLQKKYYVMVVDTNRIAEFEEYLVRESNRVVEWLDERT